MSAAILEGRTLRAYTDGLGRLSAALCESAEIIASGGAASGLPRPDSEDTGAAGGHPVHLLAADTDAPTMEEHLALHPEDAPCPECNAEDWLGGSACPRCWGDLRRGEDCPDCGGRGCGFDAPGCRCGRLVEPAR